MHIQDHDIKDRPHTLSDHRYEAKCIDLDMRSNARMGVASISRLLKIIGLFCKRAL